MQSDMISKFPDRLRSDEGTTAIEFSLLAIPFFMIVIGIIELSLLYASASMLEGATDSAARQIRTGQIQQDASKPPEEAFEDALCDYATMLIHCEEVLFEVRTMDSFSDFDEMDPVYDENGVFQPQGFDAGGSGDRVLVRTYYNYAMLTPFIGQLLGGAEGTMPFISTLVLQTEPYEATF